MVAPAALPLSGTYSSATGLTKLTETTNKPMKKTLLSVFALTYLLGFSLALFYGCGPSKAELEARQKAAVEQGLKWDDNLNAFVQDTSASVSINVQSTGYSDIEFRTLADGCEYIILKANCQSCPNSNASIIHKPTCSNTNPNHNR
jgi:hypothetical protein